MNKNQSVLTGSAIVVLLLACACFCYSSMVNKSRALKAESELVSLKKVVDANLSRKNPAVPEKKKTASPSSSMNLDFSNMQSAEPVADVRNDNSNRNRGRNAMENLKETDPERYAAMVERRNSFTKQMQENSASQIDFFKKIDTKSMTPEQLDNHNKLLPMVAENNQLLYELSQNPEAENASEIRRQIFDNSRQMRDLFETERSVALQQLAKQIGYRDDQSAQFEAYVKNVYDMTSANPFPQGGRGGGNNRAASQLNRQ